MIVIHTTGGTWMDDLPIAKAARRTRAIKYDPAPLKERIDELLKQHKESFREAALSSGLDHQAIRRIRAGYRPNMPVCILLADHWEINPNELLMLAGWPALKAFDIHTESGVLPRSGRCGEGDREDSQPGHEE